MNTRPLEPKVFVVSIGIDEYSLPSYCLHGQLYPLSGDLIIIWEREQIVSDMYPVSE